MPSKPWWKSKTIWLNVLTVAVAAGGAIAGLPAGTTAPVAIMAAVNAGFRAVTSQSITLSDNSSS